MMAAPKLIVLIAFFLGISTFVSAQSLTGTNTWTGYNYFGSGRPVCDVRAQGAVGDGTADDTAAFTDCRDILYALGDGGTLYGPPGVYCVNGLVLNTGSTVTGRIRILGSGVGTQIKVCGNPNVTTIYVNNQFVSIEQVSIIGYGFNNDSFGAATKPAFECGSGASYIKLDQVFIAGGTTPLKIECSGARIRNVTAQYAYGNIDGSVQRSANAYISNSGQYWDVVSLDQVLPFSGPGYPTYPATITPWAASTAVLGGSVKTITCVGRSWYIQAANSGTTGSVSPTCMNYGQIMPDNVAGSCPAPTSGVCWALVSPNPFYFMQADTGTNELIVDNVDMTGFALSNFAMTNTYGGTPPTNIHFHNVTPGGSHASNIYLSKGSNFDMTLGDIQGCLVGGCAGIYMESGFDGGVSLAAFPIHNNVGYGLLLGTGVSAVTANGVRVQSAKIGSFTFAGSNNYVAGFGNICLGSSAGITGTPGTSSNFTSANNPGC